MGVTVENVIIQEICKTIEMQVNNSNTTWNGFIWIPYLVFQRDIEEIFLISTENKPENLKAIIIIIFIDEIRTVFNMLEINSYWHLKGHFYAICIEDSKCAVYK